MTNIFFDINGVLALIKRPERLQEVKDAYSVFESKEPSRLRISATSKLSIEKKILTSARRIDLTQPYESFVTALRPGAEDVIKLASEFGRLYTITDSSIRLIRCACHTLGLGDYFEDFYSTKDEERSMQIDPLDSWLLISKHPFGHKLRSLGIPLDDEGDVPDELVQEHIISPTYWDGRDEDPQPMIDLSKALKEKLSYR